jgi:hypothetical protein
MTDENNLSEELRSLLCQYFQTKIRLEIRNEYKLAEELGKFAADKGCDSLDFSDMSAIVPTLVRVLWDMVMERVVEPELGIPSNPPGDAGIKALRRTEYGKQLLQGLPIDRPNKYLDHLKSRVPDIDPQIIVYVRESLRSYNLGCYFASSVMLGVASERLFELLIDAYADAIQDSTKQDRFRRKVAGKGISQQYQEFKKKLPDLVGSNGITAGDGPSTTRFRREFRHAVEITLDSIRSYRDYAAHPRDGEVPPHIIMCNLNAFPLFCQRLYQAIEWLGKNVV